MQTWKTLKRQLILDHSKWLKVEAHTVELPDGQIIEDWPWVITPNYVNVVAVMEDGQWLCFRQTKYAAEGVGLAPVGGYIEVGEVPLLAAQRELLEESGYKAPNWIDLGHYVVDGNRGAGTGYLFLAQGAQRVQAIDADDLEEQEVVLMSRSEIEAALWQGEFKVMGWALAISLALLKVPAGKRD